MAAQMLTKQVQRVLYETCKNKFHLRKFSSSAKLNSKNFEDVKIPVPWGHVAGKWWGRKDTQPILAVHGWLDNAGSWDQLAELICDNYSLLAIDLPGSGLSSHIPQFHNYHFSSSPAVLRRIQLYYGFKDLVLFAHSGGSATTFLFSSLFPEVVQAYLGVDYIFYMYKREWQRAESTGELIDRMLEVGSRDPKKSRSYKWEEAWEAWVSGSSLGASNPDLVEVLMKRGVTAIPNGRVKFNHDQRLKLLKATAIDCFSIPQTVDLAKNLDCHICYIEATDSPLFKWGIRNYPEILDVIKKSSKSLDIVQIKGNHHVHMENPEGVAEVVKKFLKKLTAIT